MGTLHIDELRPGMKLEADVRGLRNRKLFSAGVILGADQIAVMKAWGVTEAEIVGVSREEIREERTADIPPEVLEKARTFVDCSFRGTQEGNALMTEFHRLCVDRTAKRMLEGAFAPLADNILESMRSACEEEQVPPDMTPESLVASGVKLLSFPSIYTQILRELQSPACSARRMGEIVSRDPVLMAKILRLVNSPFYGFPSRIDTIERAITILGVNELTTLALGISAIQTFSQIPSTVLNMRHFWEHSMSCGILARIIAGSKPALSEERFFVAGLLHDLGMLLMLRAAPLLQCRVFLISRDRRIPLENAEREVFGFDHAEVGGLLLSHWGIPETLTQMIRHHHAPLQSQPLMDAAIINLADMLALGLRNEDYGAFFSPSANRQVLDAVGLQPSALEPLFLQHNTQMGEMMRLFFDEA